MKPETTIMQYAGKTIFLRGRVLDIFDVQLQLHLEATPDLKRRGKKILAILRDRPSRRRTRRVEMMERHAIAAAIPDARLGAIDWSSFDWSKFLQIILQVLLALLPLILSL